MIRRMVKENRFTLMVEYLEGIFGMIIKMEMEFKNILMDLRLIKYGNMVN